MKKSVATGKRFLPATDRRLHEASTAFIQVTCMWRGADVLPGDRRSTHVIAFTVAFNVGTGIFSGKNESSFLDIYMNGDIFYFDGD